MAKAKRVKKVVATSGGTPGRTENSGKRREAATKRDVRFVFHAMEAKEVYLTGEFNNWDIRSLPMKRSSGDEWQAEIDLAPGRYEYNFFVDGVWVEDPECRERIVNPFGTQNCVIQVS